MPCKLCGNHSNIDVCRRCKDCDHQHQMKFGLKWREEKPKSNEPCPQIARFKLPNHQWLTYKCILKEDHEGVCDFNVNTKTVERIARDSIG